MSVVRMVKCQKPLKLGTYELVFIFFCLWYYIIPSANSKIGFITMLGISLIYILYAVQHIPVKYVKEIGNIVIASLMIASCYYFFTVTSTISTSASFYNLKRYLSKFSQVVFAFFPYILLLRIVYCGNLKQKKAICITILLMIGYTISTTWKELLINANATRSWADFALMTEENVGTYSFVYAVSALVPTLMIVVHYAKKTITKAGAVAAITVIFSFLLIAQYTLSILIAAVSIGVYLFFSSRSILLKVALVLALPFVFLILPSLFFYAAAKVDSTQVAARLTEMALALSGGGLGYNTNGRLTLYWKCIAAFLNSPIYGNRLLDFDGHATLLTVLSDVGLLGAIPYYYLFFSCRSNVEGLIGDRTAYTKFSPVFISLMLMGFTNPIHSALPLYIVVWLLAPLLIHMLQETEEKI